MDTMNKVEVTISNNQAEITDQLNNEVSSTSSEDGIIDPEKFENKINDFLRTSNKESVVSDNEAIQSSRNRSANRMQSRVHHKSMGNIHDITRRRNDYRNGNCLHESISNIDLSLHRSEIKKFESLQIPIVGYEVMEERARFTIYKLKVEDDKRDQSWLVFRRYTDFVRLYSRLKAEQPNLLLPLPGKRWFKDNFEPVFLEERARGLQIFVNAVVSKLRNHPVVREFFCLDEPPQVVSYQPEVQAVYGALEDSITTLKMQLRQKDATIMHLQKRLAQLEAQAKKCSNCSTTNSVNAM